ncbi:MAG: holo-[acyl-carrier-protein] synthase [Syntrophus sp. (in: bacteria)]|nr:holo-[acyl-carrier-protein] synthase [Syntrophus sp. (in: bacteria)]
MIGIDIVDISRIKAIIDKHGARFLNRVFTETEIGYARAKRSMEETLAGRFAAKEAFMKASGMWLPWKDIEVQREDGRPFISFRGKRYNGLSISHERAYAVAVVMISDKK